MLHLLLILMIFGLGSGLLLRWWLHRADERPLTTAELAYTRLMKDTLALESSDMRQSVATRPGRVERISAALTGRGMFCSGEARDVLNWVERQLTLAGRPKGWNAQEAIVFALLVWALSAGGAIIAVGVGMPRWMVGAFLVVALLYPYLKLRGMVNKRQERAKLEMPSIINDLLMGIGSASGTLDDAIGRTVNDPTATGSDRILVREFAQAFAEYRHGNRDREEALRAAADRVGIEVVDNFVAALIEGLRTGTPVKRILQSQSEQVQAIFEQDMKAYIARKQSSFVISLVLIFFGVIILVMAPLFMRLSGVFSA